MLINDLINFQPTRKILEERMAYETHLYKLRVQHMIMNIESFFLQNRPVDGFEYIVKDKKGFLSCSYMLSPQLSLYRDIDFNLYDKNNQLKDNKKEKSDLKNAFSYLKLFFDNQHTLNIFKDDKSQRFDKYATLVKQYDIDPAFLKVIEIFKKNQKNKTLPIIPKKITESIKTQHFPLYNVSLPTLSFSEYEVNASLQDLSFSSAHNDEFVYFLRLKILFDISCELFSHKTDVIKINVGSCEEKRQEFTNTIEGISDGAEITSNLDIVNSLFGTLFGTIQFKRDNIIKQIKTLPIVCDRELLQQDIVKFLESLEENYHLKKFIAPELNAAKKYSRL